MSRLIITQKAADGLERCRLFLAEKADGRQLCCPRFVIKFSGCLKQSIKGKNNEHTMVSRSYE